MDGEPFEEGRVSYESIQKRLYPVRRSVQGASGARLRRWNYVDWTLIPPHKMQPLQRLVP